MTCAGVSRAAKPERLWWSVRPGAESHSFNLPGRRTTTRHRVAEGEQTSQQTLGCSRGLFARTVGVGGLHMSPQVALDRHRWVGDCTVMLSLDWPPVLSGPGMSDLAGLVAVAVPTNQWPSVTSRR